MKKAVNGFFSNIKKDPRGRAINKERCILFVILTFVIISMYIHTIEHGVESSQPHLKDEEGYYGWAELYTDGYYSIPLDEAEGRYFYESVFSTEISEGKYSVDFEYGSFDGERENNDIEFQVTDSDNNPVAGANITLKIDKRVEDSSRVWENTTDTSGKCRLFNIPFGKIPAIIAIPPEQGGKVTIIQEVLEAETKEGRYNIYAEVDVESKGEEYQLSITVLDMLGAPLEGVEVIIDKGERNTIELDLTDASGKTEYTGELEEGQHTVMANKIIEGPTPPLASGVAELDGEYHYVNHWPPGPSVIISWLMYIGLEGLFGTLMVVILALSVWGITCRTFDWKGATLATFLTMTGGITLQLYFGQWMGGLASVALAFLGLWLFMIALDQWDERYDLIGKMTRFVLPIIISFIGGIMLGSAVTMRYSTAVACFMPALFLLGVLIKDAGQKGMDKNKPLYFIKRLFSKKNILKVLGLTLPLCIGLGLIGGILLAYNANYFGGPFNSGYQAQNLQAVVSSDTAGNMTLEVSEPSASFFDSYFNWGEDDKENAPYIFEYLLVFVPLLFICIPAIWVLRKEPIIYAMLSLILLTLIIYLSQGWVLKRTVEDIRYYIPLIPPASIMSSVLLVKLLGIKGPEEDRFLDNTGNSDPQKVKDIRGKRKKLGIICFCRIMIIIGILLMILSSVQAGDYAIETRMNRGSNKPPQNGGPNGPDNGNSGSEVPIPLLLQQPDSFAGQTVKVIHCEIHEIINEKVFVIRDDKNNEEQLPVISQTEIGKLEVGNAAMVTGRFLKDKEKPDKWVLSISGDDDIESTSSRGSIGHPVEHVRIIGQQQAPGKQPPGQQPPDEQQSQNSKNNLLQKQGQKSMNRMDFPDELTSLKPLSITGIALFYLFGLIQLIFTRKDRISNC